MYGQSPQLPALDRVLWLVKGSETGVCGAGEPEFTQQVAVRGVSSVSLFGFLAHSHRDRPFREEDDAIFPR